MPNFTPEEIARLEKYVTSTESDIFAVTNLQGIVGAVYARYSRAANGFRETLLKEFVEDGNLDPNRAAELIERVLIAFGDDSVGELEGTHVSFENISILATKEIEDRRIGGSPIEKSTRYVYYDKKADDGNYRYYRDPDIMASEQAADYVEAMDFVFDTYARLAKPMREFYKSQKPIEAAEYDVNGDGKKERLEELTDEADIKAFRMTYKMDIKTKACDTLRYLLPLSTLTNVGVFGNGRFFQNLLSWLWTTDLPEADRIGDSAKTELDKVISRYVKRAKKSEYLTEIRQKMESLSAELLASKTPEKADRISLMDRGEAGIADRLRRLAGNSASLDAEAVAQAIGTAEEDNLLAHMLYQYSSLPLAQLKQAVSELSADERRRIIDTYVGQRRSRRDRPGRAFEAGYAWTFDCLTDFGTYKDIMRHRMTTQIRQRFTPLLGFEMPEDLEAAGFAEEALACVEKMSELYCKLVKNHPAAASYATLHGSKVRWLIGMNDREASHLMELRTIPQGHISYRRACQEMHNLMEKRSPWRANVLSHVDHNMYYWARAESEAKQRVKEKELELKKQTA